MPRRGRRPRRCRPGPRRTAPRARRPSRAAPGPSRPGSPAPARGWPPGPVRRRQGRPACSWRERKATNRALRASYAHLNIRSSRCRREGPTLFLRTSRAIGLAAAAALAVPALAAIPGATAATSQPAKAADATGIALWAPSQVTAYAYRNKTWTDLGLRVIAQGAPFELWSHRASYDDQIVTTWKGPDGDVTLPAGSMTTFSGLNRFLTITLDPVGKGKTTTLTKKACFNGYSERVKADAPARSPYPTGCWYNPYSLGSVQGVEEGWATPLLTQDKPLRVGAGEYTVTAKINPTYAALFGLTPDQATKT